MRKSRNCGGLSEEEIREIRHAWGHPSRFQDRRHVRGGVRSDDSLPLLVLRRGR